MNKYFIMIDSSLKIKKTELSLKEALKEMKISEPHSSCKFDILNNSFSVIYNDNAKGELNTLATGLAKESIHDNVLIVAIKNDKETYIEENIARQIVDALETIKLDIE